MTIRLLFPALASLSLLLHLAHFPTGKVQAVCCRHPARLCRFRYYYCPDCSVATPWCGYGPCNFFGCNCDGGCRPEELRDCVCESSLDRSKALNWSSMHFDHYPMEQVFKHIDTDGDGRISAQELEAWARKSKVEKEKMIRGFLEMDTNRDGFLTRNEIDSDWND